MQNKIHNKNGPQKMKAYGSYLDWKKDQSLKNRKIISALERLIKKTAPSLDTIVKWGQGCWVLNDTPRMYIHTEPDHVQLGFYAGSRLKDPEKFLVGAGKYVRHMKIRSTKDIDEGIIVNFIKQVIKS